MDPDERARRLAAQFGPGGDRGVVWEALSLVLPAERYLNLGYSPRWGTHLLGSPQARLVRLVARELERHGGTAGGRLLDLGCGRGGPAATLARRRGCPVVGVDLVAHNLRLARTAAPDQSFVRADARDLPLADGSCAAATAIDALVYVPKTEAVLSELERVLAPGGIAVVTDLLVADGVDPADPRLERFADAWDMAPLETRAGLGEAIEGAGLAVRADRDLTPNSVGRFRRWTGLYRRLATGPTRPALAALARRLGLDLRALTEQVGVTHEALPGLCHRLVVLEAD